MRSSDSITKIAPALVAAINSIEGVKKASTNPHYKSKYANLEGVIEAAHESLVANGLAVIQGPGPLDGNALTLTTRLIHESGEWIETDFSLPMAKADPQAAGSALTYARRYSLMAMLNMPAVDDDGNEAAKPAPKHEEPKKPVPTLNDRADAFVQAINNAKTPADLDKVEANGSGLMAQLDTADPEKLVAIQDLIAKRRDDMSIPFQ